MASSDGGGGSGLDFPLAIQLIHLCAESRRLCVANSIGQVMLYKFRKPETQMSIPVLEVPVLSDYFDDIYGTSPDFDFTSHQVQKSSESSDSEKVIRTKNGFSPSCPTETHHFHFLFTCVVLSGR